MKTEQAVKIRKDEDTQTFQELLESIANLSSHVVNDNKVSIELDANFPLSIRKHQINSLDVLLFALKSTLKIIEFSIDAEKDTQDGLDK